MTGMSAGVDLRYVAVNIDREYPLQMTITNERGNFRFTRGSAFYSSGVIADRGFEIVRATFDRWLPLAAGFEAIQNHLRVRGRPLQALCSMELRAPAPYPTRPLFMEFNSTYVDWLRRLDLLVDGIVPITRANLAVVDGSVSEQRVYAFAYTVPSKTDRAAFMTSATADLRIGPDGTVENVAGGDVSPSGLREKTVFVLEALSNTLRDLGASWNLATQIGIYTVHQIGPLIPELILPMAGPGSRNGMTWHYTKPPVQNLEIEIDVRAVLQELMVELT